MPIVIKKSASTGQMVTLKYDNHGKRQAMLLTQGSWDEGAIGLLRTLSISKGKLDSAIKTRCSRRKHTAKM